MDTFEMNGTVVKVRREQRAWSQEQLAAVAGISPRTVQRVEAGDRPSNETLIALANAFGMDVTELKRLMEAYLEPSDETADDDEQIFLAPRVQSGTELLNLLKDGWADCSSGEISEGDDKILVSDFYYALGYCNGTVICASFPIIRRLCIRMFGPKIEKRMNSLRERGYLIFATRAENIYKSDLDWVPPNVGHFVCIVHESDPQIVRRNHDVERIPVPVEVLPYITPDIEPDISDLEPPALIREGLRRGLAALSRKLRGVSPADTIN